MAKMAPIVAFAIAPAATMNIVHPSQMAVLLASNSLPSTIASPASFAASASFGLPTFTVKR